jgi:glycosyltransferase involved in cell wall biosynthesis
MDAIAARTGLRGHVIVARSLSSPALRQVITHARALLMPSLAEGYGLPVAEALTLGTPVVASNIPSHLEVAGDCARFCPPGDVVAWDTAITRLTFDPEFAAASRAMAARFTPLPNKLYYARVDAFLRRF